MAPYSLISKFLLISTHARKDHPQGKYFYRITVYSW